MLDRIDRDRGHLRALPLSKPSHLTYESEANYAQCDENNSHRNYDGNYVNELADPCPAKAVWAATLPFDEKGSIAGTGGGGVASSLAGGIRGGGSGGGVFGGGWGGPMMVGVIAKVKAEDGRFRLVARMAGSCAWLLRTFCASVESADPRLTTVTDASTL